MASGTKGNVFAALTDIENTEKFILTMVCIKEILLLEAAGI